MNFDCRPGAGNGIALSMDNITAGRVCVFTAKPELGKPRPAAFTGSS